MNMLFIDTGTELYYQCSQCHGINERLTARRFKDTKVLRYLCLCCGAHLDSVLPSAHGARETKAQKAGTSEETVRPLDAYYRLRDAVSTSYIP